MDEQIQSILNQAMGTQTTTDQTQSTDPVDSILQSAGAAPQISADVSNAEGQIGNQDDDGMCQRFAEKVTNSQVHYLSAIDAWNDYVKQGKANADISQAPQGALIYYSPDTSNGDFGHVAVTDGKGNQIGATYNGVELTPINEWQQSTGQKPLGYVIP